MLKYNRKIEPKKLKLSVSKTGDLLSDGKKIVTPKMSIPVLGDWEFWGKMPTGEPVWFNKIDDYTLMCHVN